MDTPAFILVGVAGLVVAVAAIAWHVSRSNSVLRQWADRNGYRIIEQEYRYLMKGPFFLTSSKNQTVYRVTIEDEHGRQRCHELHGARHTLTTTPRARS